MSSATVIPDKASVCGEAYKLVHGDRGADYGHPWFDFSRTAKMWSAILGIEVEPRHVAMCMVAIKLSRLINSPNHHDSIVDVAGYAETYGMVMEYERGQGEVPATLTSEQVRVLANIEGSDWEKR